LNSVALHAKKTGIIILGGGLIKHHIMNANLMRNGGDFCLYINTGQEFDGSDAGASPDEAKSWGKIKVHISICFCFYLFMYFFFVFCFS
jgi:deoxyhypusine synthase